MKPPKRPVFLERHSYRMHRLRDAVRLLPFFGVFLFCVPLFWGDFTLTSSVIVFVFSAWIGLVLIAAVLHRISPDLHETIEDEDR